MDYYRLFELGIKPAVYETVAMDRFLEFLPQWENKYPYINKGISLVPESEFYLFFQNEDLKESFQREMKNVNVGSLEFHRLLGLALGYPPKAVDFFVKCEQKLELEQFKVGMHYLGIPCNGSVHDLVENCFWLWDTYLVPDVHEKLEVRIGYNFHSVDYKDVNRLKELQKMALTLPVSAN